jgi:energy-coupling factor transporter ATP-binding protein EcfA2
MQFEDLEMRQITNAALSVSPLMDLPLPETGQMNPRGINPRGQLAKAVERLQGEILASNFVGVKVVKVRALTCRTLSATEVASGDQKVFYSLALERAGLLGRVIAVLRISDAGSKAEVALESKEVISSPQEILLWFVCKYCSWPDGQPHAEISYGVWGTFTIFMVGTTGDIATGFIAGAAALVFMLIATVMRTQKTRELDRSLASISKNLKDIYRRVGFKPLGNDRPVILESVAAKSTVPSLIQELEKEPWSGKAEEPKRNYEELDGENIGPSVEDSVPEPSRAPAQENSFIRGRQLISFDEARRRAERDLEPWDFGLNWGGLQIPSKIADKHFCIVGASGSGKTMLLRLLMQSAFPRIGAVEKTKDFSSTNEVETEKPSWEKPSWEEPSWEEPSWEEPSWEEPSWEETSSEEPSSVDIPLSDNKVKHRALVYDAKKDILSILHGMEDVKCPIVTLNPLDKRCAAWNMAEDIKDPGSAQQIALLLIPENSNASQPFFDNAARAVLEGVFKALMVRKKEKWDFRDVLLAIDDLDDLIEILQGQSETEKLVQKYSLNAATAGNLLPLSILAQLSACMNRYITVAATWHRAQRKISLRHWLDNEYILVLGNSETQRSAIDPINRVIFQRVTELILDNPENRLDSSRTWIFLDELREAGKLEGLGRLINKSRSKGACVVLGFQDIEGMREAFTEKLGNEIAGMPASKAILRLDNPLTAKWASEIFGEFEAFEEKESRSVGIGESSSKSSSLGSGTNTGSGTGARELSGILSHTTSDSYNDSTSETASASESKNRSQSINRERVQRAALLPAEFLALPASTRRDGLFGYFVGGDIGAYQAYFSGKSLEEQLNKPKLDVDDWQPCDPESQYLQPWSASERAELKLSPPKGTQSSLARSSAPEAQSSAKIDLKPKPVKVPAKKKAQETMSKGPATKKPKPEAKLPDVGRRKARKTSEIDFSDFKSVVEIE